MTQTASTDFLIIGGGIAGVSAAAELAPLGSTRLIEAEAHLAYHASGRSAALYEPFYGPPPMVTLSLASREGLDAAGVLSPRGVMLVVGHDDAGLLDEEAALMRMTEIDREAALAACPGLDPAKLARAALGGDAQDIDTDKLIQSYLRRAKAQGAQVELSAPATAITRRAGLWRVATPRGEFSAAVLVNAAGAWADPVAQMAGVAPKSIVPHRRSMARIAAPAGVDVSGWPMLLGARDSFYAKPDAGALIVSPGDAESTTPHDAWADDLVLAEGLARYEALMRYPVERMLANWAGLRSFAPDGAPVYGRDPDEPDFIWFAGQGGYGFQSSVAAARLIADLVAERPTDPELTRAIDPARFA
ncbi:NAD(P)/FAD-dependent oxidoreductase [Paracoccus aminophilus]|uniref:FAD dependent oxidoreductase n=1 Tax=Paracoccus aminophilus JCM 7686 TaxID=1367847 RepID=S5XSB9_PARAH|nr:FAD-binding oxidoreductase [Paracoccus aminophilus]AGT08012.1 FAD dependent oxidoreductase [Paracoccus aminophilus JCM 7686]